MDIIGLISDWQVWSLYTAEQDTPEFNKILTEILFNFPIVYVALFMWVSVGMWTIIQVLIGY